MTIFIRMPNKGLYLTEHFKTMLRSDYDPAHNYEETLICWGCSVPSGENTVLNNGSAFRKTADKPAFRELMSRRDVNVRVPKTYLTAEAALNDLKGSSGLRLIGRPRYHRGGQSVFDVTDEASLADSVEKGAEYWTQYLKKDREVRVFVALGRVWTVSEKLLPPEQQDQIAWNWEQGGRFDVIRWSKWPTKACWFALAASKATGLAFGSYDLIHYEGAWWMLEGNTSTQIQGDYKIHRLQDVIAYHEEYSFDWLEDMGVSNDFHDYIHPALKDSTDAG